MNPTIRLIAIIALLGLALTFPRASWAQKPALTESIDEPGRNPYTEGHHVNNGAPANFSAVPSGKRLVIKNLSCELFSANNYSGSGIVQLVTTASNASVGHYFAVPSLSISTANGLMFFNADTLAYADNGSMPQVEVFAEPATSGECTLTGYYVTVP